MRSGLCCACGADDTLSLEHHHLLPRALGGSDDETNLITLCSSCHGKIHGAIWVSRGELVRRGMQAAKARGVKFGGLRGPVITAEARAISVASRSQAASRKAADILPLIAEARAAGAVSLREIAAVLNERGIPTAKGGQWQAVQVKRVLDRV